MYDKPPQNSGSQKSRNLLLLISLHIKLLVTSSGIYIPPPAPAAPSSPTIPAVIQLKADTIFPEITSDSMV